MIRAAIDIGTVTTRLLVAEVVDGAVREIVRRTVVTHLGEGLHDTGRLSDAAIERVADAVGGFLEDEVTASADDVVAVATSAARDAANGREFLARIEALGVRPRIIPGSTEARLSFIGATYAIHGEGILVADLGGGSTELVFGSVHGTGLERTVEIEAARSLDVGSRRCLDRFLHSDPPTPIEMAEAADWIVATMRPFFDGLREAPRTLVTLAGTGTTLSAVKQSLKTYDPERVHLSCLLGGEVADLREELAAMPVARRREVAGMDPARAEVIVAGALILEAIIGLSGLDSTVVSEHDILYGLVLEGI